MNNEKIETLENLKTYIENLSKYHQIEILKILNILFQYKFYL